MQGSPCCVLGKLRWKDIEYWFYYDGNMEGFGWIVSSNAVLNTTERKAEIPFIKVEYFLFPG